MAAQGEEGLQHDDSTRFQFGENWAAFAVRITDARIAHAVAELQRLIPPEVIAGKRFPGHWLRVGAACAGSPALWRGFCPRHRHRSRERGDDAQGAAALPSQIIRVRSRGRQHSCTARLAGLRYRLQLGRASSYGRPLGGDRASRAAGRAGRPIDHRDLPQDAILPLLVRREAPVR